MTQQTRVKCTAPLMINKGWASSVGVVRQDGEMGDAGAQKAEVKSQAHGARHYTQVHFGCCCMMTTPTLEGKRGERGGKK